MFFFRNQLMSGKAPFWAPRQGLSRNPFRALHKAYTGVLSFPNYRLNADFTLQEHLESYLLAQIRSKESSSQSTQHAEESTARNRYSHRQMTRVFTNTRTIKQTRLNIKQEYLEKQRVAYSEHPLF